MTTKQHERRIHVPPGHELRRTGTESLRREGVETRLSHFEVVDPSGGLVSRYVIRESQATQAPFAASVTVEAVDWPTRTPRAGIFCGRW